jgi:hypothetical protein
MGVGGGTGRVGMAWIAMAAIRAGICWLGELDGVHRYGMRVREVFVVCVGTNIGMKGVAGGIGRVWVGVAVIWVGIIWMGVGLSWAGFGVMA